MRVGFSFNFAFGIAALVRQGIKTATCSALMGYEKDQIPLPQKRDLSIVLDGSGNPVLVIETLSVVILPFNEVSEQFVFDPFPLAITQSLLFPLERAGGLVSESADQKRNN